MLIGLTGGIGCGKSTIAQGLQTMGYPVYDTDSNAKRLIVSDPKVREAIQQLFGDQVICDGLYDSRLVAAQVFRNPNLLLRLNAIVHPAVIRDVQAWLQAQSTHPIEPSLAFVESAILYDCGLDKYCDAIVAITAPLDTRIQRVMARDHATEDQVRARIAAQHDGDALSKADLIINNDGNTEIFALCLQIQDFFRTFAG